MAYIYMYMYVCSYTVFFLSRVDNVIDVVVPGSKDET